MNHCYEYCKLIDVVQSIPSDCLSFIYELYPNFVSTLSDLLAF